MQCQLEMLRVLLKDYERHSSISRLKEIEDFIEISQDSLKDMREDPKYNHYVQQLEEIKREVIVLRLIKGVPRKPSNKMPATQAYQKFLSDPSTLPAVANTKVTKSQWGIWGVVGNWLGKATGDKI